MTTKQIRRSRRFGFRHGIAVGSVLLLLTGCLTGGPDAVPRPLGDALTSNMHGVGGTPAGVIYLATHDALYTGDGSTARTVGAGDRLDVLRRRRARSLPRLRASVTPDGFARSGQLLESTDGGAIWRSLSRRGISDVHT